MRMICIVKFVPDPESIGCGPDTGGHRRMILNPDDACALAFALQIKAGRPDCDVEVVTLGPPEIRPHMEDLLRLAVDRGALISDPLLRDSDSFVTSQVLARYITRKISRDTAGRPYDCLLTGSQSLDGGSAQVPALLAETLDLDQMTGIIRIDPDQFTPSRALFQAMDEKGVATYEMAMPGVLSLTREAGYKLPYVKLSELQRDVADELALITCRDLGFSPAQVGRAGSLIRVAASCPVTYGEKDRIVLDNDEEGITRVMDFLRQKGIL